MENLGQFANNLRGAYPCHYSHFYNSLWTP